MFLTVLQLSLILLLLYRGGFGNLERLSDIFELRQTGSRSGRVLNASLRVAGSRMTGASNIRIMVIDDQAVVRQGFVALINTVADMQVIAEGTNGQQAIDLFRQHQPDITLMDLRMPVIGGVDALFPIPLQVSTSRLNGLTTSC